MGCTHQALNGNRAVFLMPGAAIGHARRDAQRGSRSSRKLRGRPLSGHCRAVVRRGAASCRICLQRLCL